MLPEIIFSKSLFSIFIEYLVCQSNKNFQIILTIQSLFTIKIFWNKVYYNKRLYATRK